MHSCLTSRLSHNPELEMKGFPNKMKHSSPSVGSSIGLLTLFTFFLQMQSASSSSILSTAIVSMDTQVKDFFSMLSFEGCDKFYCWVSDGKEHLRSPNLIAPVVVTFLISCLAIRSILNGKRDGLLPPFAPIRVRDLIKMSNIEMHWKFLEISRSFGTVFRIQITPLRQTYVVSDVSVARAILNDKSSTKPLKEFSRINPLIDGRIVPHLTSKEGPMWKDSRKSVAHGFATQHIKRMKSVCHEQLEKWILESIDSEKGKPFDVFREMTKLTLRIISTAAFEYDMNDSQIEKFITDTNIFIREGLYMQRRFPWRKYCKRIIPSVRRGYQASSDMTDFAKEVLASYREKVKLGIESSEDTLIKILENSSAFKAEYEKIAEITGFLVAGFESTASTIAWTLLELAKNPNIVQDYRREIKGMPNVYDWANTDSLRRIVREGMRLYPVVIVGSLRKVSKNIHTKSSKLSGSGSSSGFIIPKGATVWIPFLSVFRNPKYYSNPDSFDPSRWINPSKEAMDALMPFSVGRRNCVGQSLANAEVHTVVAKLAAEYNLQVKKEGEASADGLTLNKMGTWLIAEKKPEYLG